jgi:hypothetical protein
VGDAGKTAACGKDEPKAGRYCHCAHPAWRAGHRQRRQDQPGHDGGERQRERERRQPEFGVHRPLAQRGQGADGRQDERQRRGGQEMRERAGTEPDPRQLPPGQGLAVVAEEYDRRGEADRHRIQSRAIDSSRFP